MANRLRQQISTLISDSSSNKLSVIDASSRLYRIAQFDTSNNATLSNITNLSLGNKKFFEDKYTIPNGLGPYQVDAIPIVLNDKFKMPKFISSTNTTTADIATTELFDTTVAPEIIVFVPSNRTTVQTSLAFKQGTSNEVDNLGTFQTSLEDNLLQLGRQGNMSPSLYAKFLSFKTAVSDIATTDVSRNLLLNNLLNDTDFQFIKNNLKYPFKVWDQVKLTDGSDNFVFDELLDLSGVPLKNQLLDGSYYTTKSVRSSWPLDASGNPTQMLPIAQNVNALGPIDVNTGKNTTPLNANNKMGLFILNLGNGNPHNFDYGTTWAAGLLASFGYVVMVMLNSPLNSNWCRISSKQTISKLLSNKVISKLDTYDLSNNYLICPTLAYVREGTGSTATLNRQNFQAFPSLPASRYIYERSSYQGICVLNKLGLYKYIDFKNVVTGCVSAGGRSLSVHHNIQPTGVASQFSLNNVDGTSKNIKPYLFNLKALLNWQGQLTDNGSISLSQRLASAEDQYNNRFTVAINELQVPMVTITGDGDIYDPRANNNRDMGFNNMAQVVYQLTKKSTNAAQDQALAKSMVIYSPVAGHQPQSNDLDLGDGEYGAIFTNGFALGWLDGGWKIPLNPSWPQVDSLIETASIRDEYAYVQYQHLKVGAAIQLAVHRFLGEDYPVPAQAFGSLGLRVDIMPTACDVATHFEYMKVGPTAYITYDASYNIQLETNTNKVTLSVDASKNLITDATSITFSKRKIYEDKYTLPNPTGPYQVDCIPMQLKDQFLMPKFGANRTGDNALYNGITSVGASGESVTIGYTNNLHTDNLYNTYVAPELDVFVPSSRATLEMTPMFKDGVDGSGTVACAGTFATSLEDALLLGAYSNSVTGSTTLDTLVNTFKTSVQSASTTQSDRTTKLNAIYSNSDYALLKNNMKYPFKVWNTKVVTDNADGKRKFSYSPLNQVKTDISNNGVAIPMITSIGGGSYANTLVTDSEWTLDASGNPTSLLPVASNQNAISNKMGLLLLFNGTASNPTANSTVTHFGYNLASYGYVTVACHGSPLNGSIHRFEGPKTICKALADRNTDPSGMPFISYDTSNNLLDVSAGCYWRSDNLARNTYFVPSSSLYNNPDGVLQTTDKAYEVNRLNVKTMISTPAAKKVYQRYFYQVKCVLDKLGLLQYINLDNVLVAGLSGGGFAPIAFHQLLTESSIPSASLTQAARTVSGGLATVYKCNNTDGTESTVFPKLAKIKAFFNLQSNVGNDLSLVPDCAYNPNLGYVNNGLSAPVKKLLVPMITITSDFDTTSSASSTSATPMRDNFYNHQAQIVYQLTQKAIETNGAYSENNAILALAKSLVLYRPASQHTPAAGPVAVGDGEFDAAYAGNSFANWIKGWELSQYVQFPNINNSIDLVGSELAYQQEEDIKTTLASALIAHRFLGNDFPIPQVALDNLGIRYDIGPLSCDVNTDFEFMKVGPKTQISYDSSYNLQVTAPGLTITSISSAPPTSNIDYVNLAPIGSTTIKVDASSNVVLDGAKGIILKSSDGSLTFRLSVDASGNLSVTPV